MSLFDEFERTHDGPSDTGESLYAYINRAGRPQAAEARELSEQWFADYSRDAPESELKRFAADFRSKGDKQHYAAWFELLVHQTLVRVGLGASVHPDLPGSDKHPDFAAIWEGSRILVEATVVAPDKDPFAPSSYEKDAQEKLTQLEIANFTARILSVSGTLKRRLKNKEIKREFGKLIAKHDPGTVQRRIDQFGYGARPTEIVRFGDWQLTVELLPRPPDKRDPRKARVAAWPQTKMHDASVPQVQEKIKGKLRSYGETADPLVLAVNVYNRGGFSVGIDGHDTLYANDGIWSPQRPTRERPAAVIFFTNTNSYSVRSTEACLYLNPSVDSAELPSAPGLFNVCKQGLVDKGGRRRTGQTGLGCAITRNVRQDAFALREVRVRTVRPDEEPRWNELMRERHYLGFRNFCGKRLRQVAVHGERWLALIGWHAAALHCAARDRWIGWSSLQRRQRLFLVANQSRFLLLSEAGSSPHLASRVLGLSLRQLPREWQRLHGSALLLAESFVDPARFAGTCYRAANWIEVGATQGFGRVRGGAIGYRHHGAPKRVFVYPLRRDARQQLAAARAQPAWRPHQPRLMLNNAQWRSLRSFLDQVPDTRSRRGLRYPMRTALTILLGSRLAGCQTLTELSDFGRALSQQTLAAIGSRRRPQTGRYEAPCISSWHYLLKRIDAAEVERLLAAWTAAQVLDKPADSADGEAPLRAIAMDGKVLRGSYDRDLGADGELLDKPAQQQLSALDLDSGTVVGQLGFSGQKEDAEGAALRVLARTFADSGMCVIADALHTQRGTAQELLGLGLDFVFTVKANQPNVLAQVHEGFHWDCMSAHQSLSCEHGRIETRSIRVADELDPTVPYVDFPGVRFVAQLRRQVEYKKDGRKRKPETVYLLTSLPPEQATPRRLLRLNRCYWGIENRIHWVRDVALREDHSRIRKGTLPRLLAAFANFAISLLRLLKTPNIKRRMAQLRLHPNQAVALLLG